MSQLSRRLAAGIGVAALAGAALGAQQPAPPQAPQIFRSGTQVVEVDARVFDKDGRFVTTLTRDDFEVLEDGVPQELVAMELVGTSAGSAATPAQPIEPTEPTEPVEPAPLVPAPQTWIFFFDLNHLTPGGGFDRARKAAADYVRTTFKEGDLAGVVAGGKMINNRLTSVRAELVAAVESIKPQTESRNRRAELTREWPRLLNEEEAIQIADNNMEAIGRAVTRACSDDPDACKQVPPDAAVREKGQRLTSDMQRSTLETLQSLNALSTGLARLAGPKAVVFFSDGFAIAGRDSTLRSVVGQAARAGARFYSIDVRGLDRQGGSGIIDQAHATDAAGPATRFDAMEDGFNSLAVDTGGLMIRNENNIGRALETISRDASLYYVLGYQPANATFDGKYRSIDVRVKRDGLKVRARRGYLAIEPAKMLKTQPIATLGPPAVPVKPESTPEVPEAAAPPAPAPLAALPAVTPPPPAAVAAPGEIAVASTASAEGAFRMRPDAEERVRALSGSEDITAADAASRGWSAYQQGDLESALPLFQQSASLPGVKPWALYALGLTHAGLGHPAEAIAAWERVRAAAPDYEAVYIDLAATYASQANLTSALAVLRDAEKRWPGNAEIQNGIGVILVRREAYDDAIAAFTKAAAAAPDEAVTHLNLGRAYELRFMREQRFVSSQRRWVAPEGDRRKAAESYERCVALGGPYAAQAAAALGRLNWSK